MATNPVIERRVLTSKVQLRAASGKNYAEGYAAVFNSYSGDLGGFREMISPGAFTRAIREKQDVRCLLNHDPNFVLGRSKSGTLALAQDSRGLHFRCELGGQQYARDLRESMARGDIDQCSFGFFVVQPGGDDWAEDIDENSVRFVARRVRDLTLYDVSCVTYPAYTDTSCQVSERALVEARQLAGRTCCVIAPTLSALTPEQEFLDRARRRSEEVGRKIAVDAARAYYAEVEAWRATGH
jgi:HK97 family phage prohead protease